MSSASAQSESQPVWRMFAFTFSLTAAYLLCRTVADSLLLSRVGPQALPPMIVVGAITVGTISFLWARTSRRQRLRSVIIATQAGTIAATTVLLILLKFFPDSSPVVAFLYLLAEVRSCLNAIMLALLLNLVSGKNDDKGTFALVNAGAPLAGIIVGGLIGLGATELAPSSLLIACVGFDGLSLSLALTARVGARVQTSARQLRSHTVPTVLVAQERLQRKQQVASYGMLILWVVVLKSVVLTLVDYEWKIFAADHYRTSERQLTSYFGLFYAVSDALTLTLQLVLAKHFLKGVTMVRSLYLLPVYLLLLGIAVIVCSLFPVGGGVLFFWLMTFARGSLVIRRGLHDVVLQVLYGRLPRSSRRMIVARILGMAKPISEATTAFTVMLLAATLPAIEMTWVWIPSLMLWIYLLHRLIRYWKQMTVRDRKIADSPESLS